MRENISAQPQHLQPVQPIFVAELFPALHAELMRLLRDLSAEDWNRPTVCALWNVKDIASHLLDVQIRWISMFRDGHFGEPPTEDVSSYQGLVGFLNRLNNEWVHATKRISPALLVHLLDDVGQEASRVIQSLDPFADAAFGVSWAGEEQSKNWFDIARNYTELWHHQQQIRLAVGREGAMERALYHPVLDTFLRALPHAYRAVQAEAGTLVCVSVTGAAGGEWFLQKEEQGERAREVETHGSQTAWKLYSGTSAEAQSSAKSVITIPQAIAWRMFTKGISAQEARKHVLVTGAEGSQELGEPIFQMLAVMA